MSPQYTVLTIFLTLVALLYSGKCASDLGALLSLTTLLVLQLITPQDAFHGFTSDAVILIIGSFFLSGALKLTGVSERLGKAMVKFTGTNELKAVAATIFLSAAVSSFMNNVAAVAVMLPAVASLSKHAKVNPKKLYIPLSFSVLLGGTCTLIGKSGNLLASESLKKAGERAFSLMEFFPLGISLTFIGLIYFIFIGRKLLGCQGDESRDSNGSLLDIYRLKERMFSLYVPKGSSLDSKSLSELRLGSLYGVEVMAIKRGNTTYLSPGSLSVVSSGDILAVTGRSQEFQKLQRIGLGSVKKITEVLNDKQIKQLSLARITVSKKHFLINHSVAEIGFRPKTGFLVVSIIRDGIICRENIAHEKVLEGDILIAVGSQSSVHKLKLIGVLNNDYTLESITESDECSIFGFSFPSQLDVNNLSIRELGLRRILGLSVVGIIRGNNVELSVAGDQKINNNDILILAGHSDAMDSITTLTKFSVSEDIPEIEFENERNIFQEIILSPRSKLIGKTLEEIDFTKKYGLRTLSIWRNGEPKRTRFSKSPLAFGDALLVQGSFESLSLLSKDSDFVILGTEFSVAKRPEKAPWALVAFIMLVGLSALKVFPPSVVSLITAMILVLSGAIKTEEAYEEIDLRLIMVIGGMLPFQFLFPKYGLTDYMAGFFMNLFHGESVFWLALVLTLLSCLMTHLLDATVAVVILAPIAISLAHTQQLIPQPLVMAVAVGSSFGFLSPLGHRAHLLILGPGGYSHKDFFKVGVALTIICATFTAFYCALGV